MYTFLRLLCAAASVTTFAAAAVSKVKVEFYGEAL